MASYKDSANIKFNPYVQTLPVEAMAKVGQYKQQRYDQGVQKIQQSIDNIAGLDITRPEDKQYLQSKLNALGNQLTNVAGGDFSNFSLVNSVNGMTNQIVKDPGVMNAVSNTARYKKDLTTVEKLNSEGKWAPSNQAAFQKDVNNWFQGGQDAKYSANVSPYVDVTKESLDIIKALASKVTTSDVAVEKDSRGNFVIYDAITRRKVDGISKERIATALKSGLSPQAYRQLAIDGQYKYSGTSPDQYISDINETYQKDFLDLTTRREMLTNSLSSLSPAEQTKANKRIEDIDRAAVQLKNEYDSVSSGFESGDVDGSQAQYYTMNFLDNTSNAYASKTESITFHTSPFKTQDNFERKMQQTQDNWDNMYALKVQEYNLKVQQDRREQAGIFGDLTLPTDTEQSGVERTNARVMMDALNVTADAKTAVSEATKQLYNLGLDDATIAEKKKNTSAITDPNIRNAVQNLINSEKQSEKLSLKDTQIAEMAKELYKLPGKDELISNNENFIYGRDSAGGVLYHTIGDGNNALDVYDLGILIDIFDNDYKSNVSGTSAFGTTSYIKSFPKEKAKKTLTPLQYGLYEMYIDPDKQQVDVGYNTLNNSNILDRNQFNNYLKGARAIQRSIKEKLVQQKDWMEEQYASQEQVNLIKTSTINKDNFEELNSTLGQLVQLAKSAESGELPTAKTRDGDIRSATEIAALLKDGVTTASVYTDQAGSQGLIINDKRIPIPETEFQKITKGRFNPSPQMEYYNYEILPSLLNTLPELMQVNKKDDRGRIVMDEYENPIKETVTKPRGYFTTSIDGEYNLTTFNAQYSTNANSFPQLENSYKVWMNFNSVQDPNSTQSLGAQMLVKDPITQELTTLNFTVTPEHAVDMFDLRNSNGSPILEQLIYQKLNEDRIRNNEMPENINDAVIKISENKTVSYKAFLEQQSKQYAN